MVPSQLTKEKDQWEKDRDTMIQIQCERERMCVCVWKRNNIRINSQRRSQFELKRFSLNDVRNLSANVFWLWEQLIEFSELVLSQKKYPFHKIGHNNGKRHTSRKHTILIITIEFSGRKPLAKKIAWLVYVCEATD